MFRFASCRRTAAVALLAWVVCPTVASPLVGGAESPLVDGAVVSRSSPPTGDATPVKPVLEASSLTAVAGTPIRLTLKLPTGESWKTANIGQAVIRTHGLQEQISTTPVGNAQHVAVTVAKPGLALIIVDAGPASEKGKSDSWQRTTYCTKLVLRIEAKGGGAAGDSPAADETDDTGGQAASGTRAASGTPTSNPGITAKVGSKLEVLPYIDPTTLRLGDNLPVRIYYEGIKQTGQTVKAYGPKGVELTAVSDSVGIATLPPITSLGLWVVRYEKTVDGAKYTADLVFEVVAPRAPAPAGRATERQNPSPTAEAMGHPRPGHPQPPTVMGENWIEMGPAPITTGPYTGRTSAIVASPTDPDKYFVAGADGGVWRTLDGGKTWTPLTDDLPICAMGALALDPNDEDIIYAGSGEANYANHSVYGLGLYKSTDGGDSWEVLAADTFAGRTFARLAVSPTDSKVLYAAIGHAGGFPARVAGKGHPLVDGPVGIFKSQDGGVSWTQLLKGLPNVAATDLVVDPTDGDTVYAAIGDIFGKAENGIYRSRNGGERFKKLTEGLPSGTFGRVSLAIAPSDPDRLYTIITRVSSPEGRYASTLATYRSDNGGNSWVRVNAGSFQATYGWYLSTAIVAPDDPDVCFVGGLTLLRTTNGGTNFMTRTPQHVDMHGLAFDADGRLLSANDGGLYRSANLGDSWSALNDGLGTIQFYAGVSAHPLNRDFLLGGFQDNGTNRREGDGVLWSHRLGGDGGYTALNRFSPQSMFAETQGTGNLYYSDNGGINFRSRRSGISSGDRNCFLPPMVYDPAQEGRLLYATHRIYESNDEGLRWTPISGDLTGGPPAAIRALTFAPSNSQTVYAATNDGRVLVSTDSGHNWEVSRTNNPGWPRVTRELAVDPQDDAVAYLGVGWFGVDQVLETTDRGQSWQAIDGDLPDVPVNTVAVERVGEDRVVYVGTDHGVYKTENGGVNWVKHGEGMPNTPVFDLVVDTTHARLIATTQGRGAWYIPLAGVDCDLIRKLKVKCKKGKLKAKVRSSLPEGTALTLSNNGGNMREVTVNGRGRAKAKWTDQSGSHEVCIAQCARCKSDNCE